MFKSRLISLITKNNSTFFVDCVSWTGPDIFEIIIAPPGTNKEDIPIGGQYVAASSHMTDVNYLKGNVNSSDYYTPTKNGLSTTYVLDDEVYVPSFYTARLSLAAELGVSEEGLRSYSGQKIRRNLAAGSLLFMGEASREITNDVRITGLDEFHTDLNLASILSCQVAVNYGLFCNEIIFKGVFDSIDRITIQEWIENTAREIYVNKILQPNAFLLEPANKISIEKRSKYSAAKVQFINQMKNDQNTKWEHWMVDKNRHCRN